MEIGIQLNWELKGTLKNWMEDYMKGRMVNNEKSE